MRRVLTICVSIAMLGGGLLMVHNFYASQSLLVLHDPSIAASTYEHLLDLLLIIGSAGILVLSILIYLLFNIKTTAGLLAYSYSKDLAFSRDRLRRFYELSPVPYLLVDKDALIKRTNKAALRMLDATEDTLIGKQLFDFFELPEHAEKIQRYRDEVHRSIPIEQKELQVHRTNGDVRWVLFSAENLDSPNAKDHQVLVTLVDIHEQKELERIKTEFLSLASHQLRAPLANLKWYIDFLLKRKSESLTEEIADYLNKMYRRNEEMIDLVNTLLDLSRIEMGRVKVQKEQTNITELAHSVVEELETAAHDKQITITAQVPEQCTLETDGRLLRVILQNLLTNAIRYTNPSGSVLLNIVHNHARTEVQVTDTGVGIPPEEQGRIFSKMYRASNAQAMEANGNGIGLYMCKALTEALGGTITFTSVMGQGTTFSIVLPA